MAIQHIGERNTCFGSVGMGSNLWDGESVLAKFKASVDEDGKVKAFDTARGYLKTIPQAKNAVVGPPISSRFSRGYNYGKCELNVPDLRWAYGRLYRRHGGNI